MTMTCFVLSPRKRGPTHVGFGCFICGWYCLPDIHRWCRRLGQDFAPHQLETDLGRKSAFVVSRSFFWPIGRIVHGLPEMGCQTRGGGSMIFRCPLAISKVAECLDVSARKQRKASERPLFRSGGSKPLARAFIPFPLAPGGGPWAASASPGLHLPSNKRTAGSARSPFERSTVVGRHGTYNHCIQSRNLNIMSSG